MKNGTIGAKMPKTKIHFTAACLLNPTNPVTVQVIGSGGTGSRVITALAEINCALKALNHPGLFIQLFDDDKITPANIVRQRFAQSELGMNKAAARISHINRWYGTNWKAVPYAYKTENLWRFRKPSANIFVSCVDTVDARVEIAAILKKLAAQQGGEQERPFYWMDYGNGTSFGQVILSTVRAIPQPASKQFTPVASLPFVTEEFGQRLKSAEKEGNIPSCSAAEALKKQDLFINTTLTQMGAALLWDLFRSGMTENRGLFLNLKDLRCIPLKVG